MDQKQIASHRSRNKIFDAILHALLAIGEFLSCHLLLILTQFLFGVTNNAARSYHQSSLLMDWFALILLSLLATLAFVLGVATAIKGFADLFKAAVYPFAQSAQHDQ